MASRTEAARLLGERVRDLRRRRGTTQMDFALYIGMNVAHLGRIERGDTNPTLETIVRLADALGVDASALVKGIRAEHYPPIPGIELDREYLERKRRGER
jgi:transcriptional regulator with XRE-family HTH domain